MFLFTLCFDKEINLVLTILTYQLVTGIMLGSLITVFWFNQMFDKDQWADKFLEYCYLPTFR